MPKYRIAETASTLVIDSIQPGYTCYNVMVQLSENSLSWTPLQPNKNELFKQEWHDQHVFMDPNEVNKRMGMPPYYAVIKQCQEGLKAWIEENFEVENYEKDSFTDIVFDGEYKYADKDAKQRETSRV